jgi:hypothetical protein
MTDETTIPSEAAPVSLPEISRQIAGFESRITQSLEAIAHKLDGLENPARAEAGAAVVGAEAVLPIPLVVAPEPEGHAPGFLGGIAHQVADFAKGAVGGLRSDDVDVLGNPDGGITAAEAAEAAALRHAVGPHTQALVEERRAEAPALAVAS